ncbi:MAG TPA: aminotransferase class I/II-fold pyridoxal phosphate-dependent enzyme, partial [Candidatus Latescibacteria bacterium]|nr:aminotransferase class I/II-fold pyridoxal phosphate-dependent enzyme [Candidatus Latescibacterota bacterium]
GTAAHFGISDEVDLIMGTFSKSFASIGGFIAGEADVIGYIKHHARSLIFSASMPPASVAVVYAALQVIQEEPERIAHLWQITRKMREGYRSLGFDIGSSQTPIIPLIIGDRERTFRMWKELFQEGIFVNPAIPPAVPPGRALLRTSYMATHTEEQMEKVLEAMERVGRRVGVLRKEV